MRFIKQILPLLILALIVVSCNGKNQNSLSGNSIGEKTESPNTENIDITSIQEQLCEMFPKELILKYNTDGTKIDIESISNGSGGVLHCKVKLFYGEKEYEYWEGQVAAWVNKTEDPFWQYNPERSPTLYQKVDDLGEKAVYIANLYQLQILKGGVVYSIVPPNRGRTTNAGKENKEIAIEMASHYKL